jgi:2,3-diphosphopglycerate-independent phosphoglycerate mutase
MKVIILLGDGMSDVTYSELGNKSPLQAAATPNMDFMAQHGQVGLATTVPDGLPPGSDVANLSVFGYDPRGCYTGRSPLEAISMGVDLGPQDVSFRMNLVTLTPRGGKIYMEDFSKPNLEIKQTKDIINALQPSGLMKNFSEYREEELVNGIYNNIDEHSKTYYYNGEVFYFKDLDELASKAKIKNEIIPLFTEFENNYKSTMISWLNDGAKETGARSASLQ